MANFAALIPLVSSDAYMCLHLPVPLQFNSVAQVNAMYSQTPAYHPAPAGANLSQSQPSLSATCLMLTPGVALGGGGQHAHAYGQPAAAMMYPSQSISSTTLSHIPGHYGARQDLPSAQVHTQILPQQAQQPQQSSTQQPAKTQTATKRTTKALLM